MTVEVSVAEEGRLIWLGQPLVVGAGAAVSTSLTAELAAGARMLRGDAVVVGASFGALQSRTRIVLDGVPLLDETLSTADPVTLRSAVVAGDATMIAAVTLAGIRDQAAPPGAMQAHGPATLWRDAGGTVEVGASAAAIGERWRGHCRSPHTDARTAGYVLGDTIRR
jgi:urease accessory protein